MNELLQKHGCANVFHIPDGLRELMADISREVLRKQPEKVCDFIANYLSALLITREHGILAVKLLDDLCDCKPTVSEHLMNIGMNRAEAEALSQVIKEEIESLELIEGKEKIREQEILKKILKRKDFDEPTLLQICEITRNAYRDYWYRKRLLEETMRVSPEEPWEKAAQHTLELYKKTKPSFAELTRATVRIQVVRKRPRKAAYKGFHTRRKMLGSRKPKKVPAPKVDLPGPPMDIAESREIDLGPVVDIKDKVKTEDVAGLFQKPGKPNLGYDPTKTLTMTSAVTPGQVDTFGSNSFPQKEKKFAGFQEDMPKARPKPAEEPKQDAPDFAPKISFAPPSAGREVELPGYGSGPTSETPTSALTSAPASEPISDPISAPLSEPATDVEDIATDNE